MRRYEAVGRPRSCIDETGHSSSVKESITTTRLCRLRVTCQAGRARTTSARRTHIETGLVCHATRIMRFHIIPRRLSKHYPISHASRCGGFSAEMHAWHGMAWRTITCHMQWYVSRTTPYAHNMHRVTSSVPLRRSRYPESNESSSLDQ